MLQPADPVDEHPTIHELAIGNTPDPDFCPLQLFAGWGDALQLATRELSFVRGTHRPLHHDPPALGLVVLIFPRAILAAFTDSVDVIDVGVAPLRMMAVVMFVDAVGIILGRILAAAGCALFVMKAEITVVACVLIPTAWLMARNFHGDLTMMWVSWLLYMIAWHIAMMRRFVSGTWKTVRI